MIGVLSAVLLMQSSNVPAGYKLVFQDEFDYKGLPLEKNWTYEEGYKRNNEKQYYAQARLENSRVNEGKLTIEARQDGYRNHEVTSASITTQNKFEFAYGYVEVRAKYPTGKGTWPAIWMLGANIQKVGWPLCGEIDLLENVGFDPEKVHFNVHTKAYHHSIGTNKGTSIDVPKGYEGFHTYGMHWTKDKLVWYFDGKQVFEYKKESTDLEKWPFDDPQYLILNLAIGGSWGGMQGIDPKIYPSQFQVDYVRVYQQK